MLTGWGRQLVMKGELPPHVDRVLSKPVRLRELREAFAEVTAAGSRSGGDRASVRLPVSSPRD